MIARRIAALVISIWLGAMTQAQQERADVLLTNGKIVTVDGRFSIAGALAVRGDRIMAVGAPADVERLAGPGTRRVDLGGRTVLPGLIDNHLHLLRAGATWSREVRLDGIGSRREALDRLRARAKGTPRGEWIYTLGGWTLDQFADDPSPFTRTELDRAVPDHPLLLQASYYQGYLNSRAIEALGANTRDGIVGESDIRALAARVPSATGAALEASTRAMIADLNRMGLTTVGSAGCESNVLPVYRRWAERGELNLRVFCITGSLQPRGRGDWIDHVAYGETVLSRLHDPMFRPIAKPSAADLAEWRSIAERVAGAGIQLHVHANFEGTIDAFLDQIEAIHRARPVGDLRWTLAHTNQITSAALGRMSKLRMHAAVHPWAIINGGINRRAFGNAALDMPPLRTIQESGVLWGLGSDGTRANQIRPFFTLWFAVTGRMAGGAQVLRQPIGREDALIAHTRSNAYLLFRERDLGSLEPGKLADLIVLDRDYLTVPADQIKDIAAVGTMVGGRWVGSGRWPSQARVIVQQTP